MRDFSNFADFSLVNRRLQALVKEEEKLIFYKILMILIWII